MFYPWEVRGSRCERRMKKGTALFFLLTSHLELRTSSFWSPGRLFLGRVVTIDLKEVELHGRRTPEDRDHHLQRVAIEIDFFDDAGEVGERPVDDAHVLAVLVNVLRFRLLFGGD